jgi:cytochrome P450
LNELTDIIFQTQKAQDTMGFVCDNPVTLAAMIVALTILYFAWCHWRRTMESKKPYKDLPMPPDSHWLEGHVAYTRGDFTINNKRQFVDHANAHGQTGFWLGAMPALSVTDWRDARVILLNEYHRRRIFFYTKHFNMFLGPRNVGILQGREWKFHRAAILRSFGPTTVEASKQTVADVTQTMVRSLTSRVSRSASSSSTPLVLDIEPLVKMIAVDVFGKVAFSTDLLCCENLESSPIAKAFDYLGQDLSIRLRNPFRATNFFYSLPTRANRQHYQARTLLRSFLAGKIQERRQRDDSKETPVANNDVLSELLSTVRGQSYSMSDVDLQDTLLALLFAGYDTTSITLTYALYQISQHPEVEELILAEVNSQESLDNPDQLHYVQGVLYETLRLFPPGTSTTRFLQKPLQIQGGFVIPAERYVTIPIWLIQRDAKNFPQPLDFRPDRWVRRSRPQKDDNHATNINSNANTDTSTEGQQQWVERPDSDTSGSIAAANRGAFLAFSAGARSCGGKNFAMQEATLVLAGLVKAFTFRALDGYALRPSRSGIVQRPKGGLPMTIEIRR